MKRSVLTALLLAPIVLPVIAQRDEGEPTALERWESMDPSQRELLRLRFLEFLQFSPEERERLKEESSRLENRRRRSMRGLSDRERRLLEELEPDLRLRIVRELFRQRSLEDGSRVREKLPPTFLQELEEADPTERGRLFRDFLRERRLRDGRRLLFHLGYVLEVPEEDRVAWSELDVEDQSAKLLEVGRVFIRKRVSELGPPGGLGPAQWEAIDGLDDEDFFEVWQRLAPPAAYLPRPKNTGSGEEGSTQAQPDPDPERPGVARLDERRRTLEQWRELRELARFDVSDFVAMSDLAPGERPKALIALVRERTLEHIRAQELISGEKLEGLEALEGRPYLDALRRAMREQFSRR